MSERPRLLAREAFNSIHWLGFPIYPDHDGPMRLVIRDGQTILHDEIVSRSQRPYISLPMLHGTPARGLTIEFWEEAHHDLSTVQGLCDDPA